MIIFGNRLFGKVDTVPGLGFVATRFFHIDYVPLIPGQGWLVFAESGKGWRGVRIPISAKSVLVAWARTAAVLACVGGVIGLIVDGSSSRAQPMDFAEMIALVIFGAGLFAFTRMHRSVTRASYARACQLAKLAKLNDRGMAALAAAYGEPPMNYGFEPLAAADSAAVPALVDTIDDAIPVEEVPLDELDGVPVEDPQSSTSPPPITPAQPRQEVRRHG